MSHVRSGDGFLRCSDGHVRWGLYGAAGVVFVHREGTEVQVMLQRRSMFAHEGGTWSCPGGALHRGESALDGALRESVEEVGPVPTGWTLAGSYEFRPADDWTYTTIVVDVPVRFGESASFETDAIDWVPVDAVEQRPLHAGFAAAWPHLRRIIEAATVQGTPRKEIPMRVHVDAEKCQGHNRCYALAPELFDVDEYGQAIVRGDGSVPPELEDKARLAVANCPEYAVTIDEG